MNYKISVALCTYNGSKYIEEQLESIISQTIPPDEIIIVDDKSTDDTIEKIKDKLLETSIHYELIINDNNLGVTKNFEKAISKCKGDIIFTADQDDVWLNNKIERILKAFKEKENLLVVFTDAYLVDHQLNKIGLKLWDTVYKGIDGIRNHKEYLNILVNKNIMTGTTMAFKRSLLNYILPFNEHWIHDEWIAITGTLLGEVMGINEPLVLYRQHGKNVIGASQKSFITKTRMYMNNFKNVNRMRTNKNNRYKELILFIAKFDDEIINKEDKDLIVQGAKYWECMSNLDKKDKMNSTKIIIKEYINKNYNRFYTGFRGAFRDLITLFIN